MACGDDGDALPYRSVLLLNGRFLQPHSQGSTIKLFISGDQSLVHRCDAVPMYSSYFRDTCVPQRGVCPEQLHSGSGECIRSFHRVGAAHCTAYVPLHQPLGEALWVPQRKAGIIEVQQYVHTATVQQRGDGGGRRRKRGAADGERDVVPPRRRLWDVQERAAVQKGNSRCG